MPPLKMQPCLLRVCLRKVAGQQCVSHRIAQTPRSYSDSGSPPASKSNEPNLHTIHPVDEYGLPLHPLPFPPALTDPPLTPITRAHLHRLHRLAALNPPEPSSKAEAKLMQGLSGLIGLMDQIKSVDLELELGQDGSTKEALRKRLLETLWESEEVVIDGTGMEEQKRARKAPRGRRSKAGPSLDDGQSQVKDEVYTQKDVVTGTELLKWRRPLK